MPAKRKRLTYAVLFLAAACAGVYAISRPPADDHSSFVTVTASSDPDAPAEGDSNSPLTYWAKTSDFDTAPTDAGRDSEAPPFVPPTIFPPLPKAPEEAVRIDSFTEYLPGGAVPWIEIVLPEGAEETPPPPNSP